MGELVTNTYPGYHYRAGVLQDVKIRHHHGAESIDDTAPTISGADYLACYDAGASPPAGSTSGEAFIAEAEGLDSAWHEWLTDAKRGASWVEAELMSLPRPE